MTTSDIAAALAFTLAVILSPIVRIYLQQNNPAPITWLSTIVLVISTWKSMEFLGWGFLALLVIAAIITNVIHTKAHRNGWNHMLFQSSYLLVGAAISLLVASFLV